MEALFWSVRALLGREREAGATTVARRGWLTGAAMGVRRVRHRVVPQGPALVRTVSARSTRSRRRCSRDFRYRGRAAGTVPLNWTRC